MDARLVEFVSSLQGELTRLRQFGGIAGVIDLAVNEQDFLVRFEPVVGFLGDLHLFEQACHLFADQRTVAVFGA